MIAPPRPPSPDDVEALIREAHARQARRRLLGAAGIAITVAIGLSAYALFIGARSALRESSWSACRESTAG